MRWADPCRSAAAMSFDKRSEVENLLHHHKPADERQRICVGAAMDPADSLPLICGLVGFATEKRLSLWAWAFISPELIPAARSSQPPTSGLSRSPPGSKAKKKNP